MKQKAHDIIADLKEITARNGKVPSRDEYLKLGKFSKRDIDMVFGGWTLMKHAAGFTGKEVKEDKNARKDIIKDIFSARLPASPHINQDISPTKFGSYKRVVILGDTHFPYIHSPSLSLAYLYIELIKPDLVIQIGDLYDMFSTGRFPRSQCIVRPDEELSAGHQMAGDMWKTIRKICGAKLVQIIGNHDIRPLKKVIAQAPEIEPFIDWERFFRFEGVDSILDARELYEFDGITYHHGYLTGLGKHINAHGKDFVHGHTHKGGLIWKKVQGKWCFELDAGYLGDPSQKAFHYTATKEDNFEHGIGVITEWGPAWVPFGE